MHGVCRQCRGLRRLQECRLHGVHSAICRCVEQTLHFNFGGLLMMTAHRSLLDLAGVLLHCCASIHGYLEGGGGKTQYASQLLLAFR